MSLDFHTENVQDKEALKGKDGEWSSATQAIVFATMYAGISVVNDKTLPELWQRISMVQDLFGPITGVPYAYWEPVLVTEADLRAHKGMWTNASAKTKTQFLSWLYEIYRDTLDARRKRAEANA